MKSRLCNLSPAQAEWVLTCKWRDWSLPGLKMSTCLLCGCVSLSFSLPPNPHARTHTQSQSLTTYMQN